MSNDGQDEYLEWERKTYERIGPFIAIAGTIGLIAFSLLLGIVLL